MLTLKQLAEIRSWLERSQNPLFFFDNDPDGLASFLLLQRYINKGKGVAVKSFPELSVAYTSKLHELKPDNVFILDKPLVAKGFLDSAKQLGIPVIWIDHHPIQEVKDVYYYNPLQVKPESNEPVSYWCYAITKKDEWIAMLGCLGDWFLPEFTAEFAKLYPDIFSITKNPSEALFATEFGRLVRILSFALKDRTSNVIKMQKALIKAKSPYEILQKEKGFERIYERYEQINRKYKKLLEKAKLKANKEKNKKLLYFQYGGQISMSSELANELIYLHPNKIVVVAYIKGLKVNASLRGAIDIRELLSKALEGTKGSGGGHRNACGATLNVEDLPKFKDNLSKLIEK